jgi:hypothetical protein
MQSKSKSNNKLRNLVQGLNQGEIIENKDLKMKINLENQETPRLI